MEHRATIVEGSIEDLGANGIAFSVVCCGDMSNAQRHTISYAHTLSQEELEQVIVRKYLMPHEQMHAKTSDHAKHVEHLARKFRENSSGPDLQECDNCK